MSRAPISCPRLGDEDRRLLETSFSADRESGDGEGVDEIRRSLVRTGNYRLTNTHFQWVDDYRITESTLPEWAMVVERLEWGRFYGFPEAFVLVDGIIPPSDENGLFRSMDDKKAEAFDLIKRLEPRYGGIHMAVVKVYEDGEEIRSLMGPDDLDQAADIESVAEVIEGPERAWQVYNEYHDEVRGRWRVRRISRSTTRARSMRRKKRPAWRSRTSNWI